MSSLTPTPTPPRARAPTLPRAPATPPGALWHACRLPKDGGPTCLGSVDDVYDRDKVTCREVLGLIVVDVPTAAAGGVTAFTSITAGGIGAEAVTARRS